MSVSFPFAEEGHEVVSDSRLGHFSKVLEIKPLLYLLSLRIYIAQCSLHYTSCRTML
jgi:hypothetical protein